jgi:hypothetical protein
LTSDAHVPSGTTLSWKFGNVMTFLPWQATAVQT